MTREEYIQGRLNQTLPIELFWEYYLNETTVENRLIDNIHAFNQVFQMFQRMFNLDLYKMFSYFDNKFNINILQDKTGKIIKIY